MWMDFAASLFGFGDVEIPSFAPVASNGLPAGLGTSARRRARCGDATSAVLSAWHKPSSPNARLTISDRDARTWAVAQGGVESDVRAISTTAQSHADEVRHRMQQTLRMQTRTP